MILNDFKVIFPIIIVLHLTQLRLTKKSRCNSSLCDCSDNIEVTYEFRNVISCPQNEPIVRYEISNFTKPSFIKTSIYCSANDQLVYNVISQTDVEHFDSVQYINCPVPLNSSLGDGMPNLKQLTFQNKAAVEWKTVHFSGLNNLVKLDLQTQKLDQLAYDTFAMLPKLKEVNLKMKHPNLYLFSVAQKFQLSELDGDNLNTNALTHNPNLEFMHIFRSEFNMLTSRPFEGLVSLKELFFSKNDFKHIDPHFLNYLGNLEHITFLENGIASFPNGIFDKNKKLKRIVIQSEKINTLPNEIFSDLPELNRVTILLCRINSIPNDVFKNSDNIKSVRFSHNSLTSLPDGIFDNLSKLEYLDLNSNKLSSLPSSLFDNLKSLKSIFLGSNQFKIISAANIKVFPNSLHIYLQANQIEDIKIEDLHLFEKDTTVDLGSNRISKFSGIVHLRQHIERYNSTLTLRGNPFDCSTCDIYHIVQERAPDHCPGYDEPDDFVTKPFSIDAFDLICAEPDELTSKPVRELSFINSACSLN